MILAFVFSTRAVQGFDEIVVWDETAPLGVGLESVVWNYSVHVDTRK